MIYEPSEDSYLLQTQIKQYAFGRVLDMGTGSGIQALAAASNPSVREVIAVDINSEVVVALQKKVQEQQLRKIKVLHSNLFEQVDEKFNGKFNIIIFNPPYLPQDKGIVDAALYGGKKGWEISERFFNEASRFLLPDGVILFLFSTMTNKEKVNQILSRHLFSFKEIDNQKLAFEELYVYEIRKSPLLRQLEGKGIESIEYYAEGCRGRIYKGRMEQNQFVKKFIPLTKKYLDVAIKLKKEGSKAEKAVSKEAQWLERVNKLGIGPRLLAATENFVVTEFIAGENLPLWLKKEPGQHCTTQHFKKNGSRKDGNGDCKAILQSVLEQCFLLDRQKTTKEEMHHPHKHIIVNRFNKPVLIDFERCHEADKPQNVTQFVEYLCRLKPILETKGLKINIERLRELAKEYKLSYQRDSFEKILKAL